MWVYLWTEHGTVEYDFTKSDWWWTAWANVLRDSDWFYINGTAISDMISAPASLYNLWTPTKVEIIYKKSGTSCWTRIEDTSINTWYFLPRSWNDLNRLDYRVNGGTIVQNNIWANPTWIVTWELVIDSSTTNWTITHNITWVSSITESSWAFKTIFENNDLNIWIVNWNTAQWMYIQKVVFYF